MWLQLILVLALLAVVIWAVQSDAHTLSLAGAKRVATREAVRLANAAPKTEHVDSRVTGCHRVLTQTKVPKPHTVDCDAVFDFTKVLHQSCRSVIRVQFRSPTSRSIRITYPGEPSCHDIS